MKKVKQLLFLFMLTPFAVFSQQGFVIHGQVGKEFDAPNKIYLAYKIDTTKVRDSAVLQKGSFVFKGRVPNPMEADLYIPNLTENRKYMGSIGFYLENSDINIISDDSLNEAIIKGSKTMDDNYALKKMQKSYRESYSSIRNEYATLTPQQKKDTVILNKIRMREKSIVNSLDSITRVFIYSHLNSYIALQQFKYQEMKYDFNPDSAQQKFNKFPVALRQSLPGKEIQALIDKNKATMIGRIAPDFSEQDTLGNKVKLSDFRGHYVLVDFWASWCHPCREENPNLVAAYKKFKNDNFTILSVSLDEAKTRAAWANAVKHDSLPWTQVSELKGFKSKSAVLYAIEAIPSNFLIDPSGKIIAHNLRGKDLDIKLTELFKNK